jgi:tetratricopeptide (TPR) repeat protein
MTKTPTMAAVLALALAAGACAPRMRPVREIQPNGAIIASSQDDDIARARAEGSSEHARIAAEQDQVMGRALSGCTPMLCNAIARGELAVGMTREQVLAATHSGAAAWNERGGGGITTLTPRDDMGSAPKDVVSQVAFVTLENGRVASYAYREPQGVRVVANAADATAEGTARARADQLLREGDEFALAGDFNRALNYYDRADIIQPDNPATTLRIARALDKELRPYEALIRYQLFLHQLEIERIHAYGDAYAQYGAAVAEAHSRILVLERDRR